jgi:Acyl-CoA carboxylase epsilon subunit
MAGHLRSISPDATPDEVAAIVAALSALRVAPQEPAADDTLHEWVRAARVRARRSGLRRGPWRLSARIGRSDRV